MARSSSAMRTRFGSRAWCRTDDPGLSALATASPGPEPAHTEVLPPSGTVSGSRRRGAMTTINGLPAHILLVHAVVGLVPVTALLVVLVAVWPAARRRLTWAAAALAVMTLIAVPVTTEAGEWLEHRVERTALLRAHTELGDTMLPWAIGLAVVALAILARMVLAERAAGRAVPVAVGDGPGTTRAPAPVRKAGVGTGPGGRAVSLIL